MPWKHLENKLFKKFSPPFLGHSRPSQPGETCPRAQEQRASSWTWQPQPSPACEFSFQASQGNPLWIVSKNTLELVHVVEWWKVDLPVAVDPVKATLSMSMCSAIAAPAPLPNLQHQCQWSVNFIFKHPGKTLMTPGGNPASRDSAAMCKAESGV